jgi:hypothetical protein
VYASLSLSFVLSFIITVSFLYPAATPRQTPEEPESRTPCFLLLFFFFFAYSLHIARHSPCCVQLHSGYVLFFVQDEKNEFPLSYTIKTVFIEWDLLVKIVSSFKHDKCVISDSRRFKPDFPLAKVVEIFVPGVQ